MNKLILLTTILLSVLAVSCTTGELAGSSAGTDTLFVKNPILPGFYPDPSICKVGKDYYLVNSTFAYFPGIPVFHSNDLVNWKQIGNVVDRPDQLKYDSLGVSRGIFAPAISYNDGVFYLVCTMVDAGGNFVMTATDPAGPWSDPTYIPEIDGIDPSLFFDEDGKTYIVYNSVPPNNESLYEGHRTIRIYEFDKENLKVTGQEHLLINGGTDISKKPVWIEAPHIYRENGYYYMIAAEGGTSYQHSEVVFRSKDVLGPYESYEGNPILTQRHLDRDREFPVTSAGHADFIKRDNGEWWAVFLGCRPYKNDFYNTGRETFIAPVKWIDGWPVVDPDHEAVQYLYPVAVEEGTSTNQENMFGGNFTYTEDFGNDALDIRWMMLRTPTEKWYSLTERAGNVVIDVRPGTVSEPGNPSFLGHRQQHLKNTASVNMAFNPASDNEKAGIIIFQNENHFYYLCKSIENNNPVIQLFKSSSQEGTGMELLASERIEETNSEYLELHIESKGSTYSFSYNNGSGIQLLKENVDATFLSTAVAGGFVGCVYALYATSLGEESSGKAYFDNYRYSGNDDVYNQ